MQTDVTKNTYDSLDRLISTEDAEGRVTKYEYNRNHQIVKVIDANGVVADVRTYTDNGKIKTIKDARGNVSTYTYDGFDRKIKLEYPDGSFEAWEYDETGPAFGKTDRVTKVITRTPAGANVITQTFDDYDRLLTRTPTGQPTETYVYDLAGRLLSVSTPPVAGNPARGKFSREYDVAGRLVKEKYQNDPANPTDTKEVSYQLDPNGNITRITYPDGYYVERTFDKLNRLENIKLNGSTTAAASFVYDKLSRRTQMVFANGVTTSYQYDLADRRTGMDVQFGGSPAPALASWRYGFNKVDQMTMQKFPDSSWEWRPPAVSTTEYGAANNLNQILTAGASTLAYADGRGNLTSDGTWTYTYNTENMLIGATNGSVTVSFDYDAENRQIRKTVGSTKTRYVYSGDQLIAEYNDTTGALLRRYVYALGKDDPIMVVDASNVVTYLHADHLGSIIARTSSSGALIASGKYTYSPFGQSSSLTGTTFGFTGQRFDAELGLYHYKARYYSPALCRFLQADPAGYDVSYNLYSYASNDPLSFTDPTGRSPWKESLESKGVDFGILDKLYDSAKKTGLEHGAVMGDKGTVLPTTTTGATKINTGQATAELADKNEKVTKVYMSHVSPEGANPSLGWHKENAGFDWVGDLDEGGVQKKRDVWTINDDGNVFKFDYKNQHMNMWNAKDNYRTVKDLGKNPYFTLKDIGNSGSNILKNFKWPKLWRFP